MGVVAWLAWENENWWLGAAVSNGTQAMAEE